MKIPTVVGLIDRRILINYSVEPEVLDAFLPEPFKPKLVNGKGMAGICLIRLRDIRPKGLPKSIGISSENGAHRIAVEWMENGEIKEGVYIPRRDTSSRLNAMAGGRIFPGTHHLAEFAVNEKNGHFHVAFESEDGVSLAIRAKHATGTWSADSVFDNLECASQFYENGSVGFSPSKVGTVFDGLQLITNDWHVQSLDVSMVHSSFFENENIFPAGSIHFDNALLMTEIEHQWKGIGHL